MQVIPNKYLPKDSTRPPLSRYIPNHYLWEQHGRDINRQPLRREQEWRPSAHYYRDNLPNARTVPGLDNYHVSQVFYDATAAEARSMHEATRYAAQFNEETHSALPGRAFKDFTEHPYVSDGSHVIPRKMTVQLDATAHPHAPLGIDDSLVNTSRVSRSQFNVLRDPYLELDRNMTYRNARPISEVNSQQQQVRDVTNVDLTERLSLKDKDSNTYNNYAYNGYVTF